MQIVIVEPRGFETSGRSNAAILPIHPAYSDPSMAGHRVREFLNDDNLKLPGDPKKAAIRIVEFVNAGKKGADLPFRWMIGNDCIESVRSKIASLTEDADKSMTWSEGLQHDSA